MTAVEFDGKFHMIDSSMSNLVTNDDGVTLASVTEAAADSARLVREHSLYSTSPNGFLTGTDASRNLTDFVNPNSGSVLTGFSGDFCSAGLKFRDYYYNWNSGHRYVLNLREDESYTRYYRPIGTTPDYWVGSEHLDAPDPAHTFENDATNQFGLRGNGQWSFSPTLTSDGWARAAYRSTNIVADAGGGLRPDVPGQLSEVVYKVQAANVIASQLIQAQFSRSDPLATATISVSLNHGATWIGVADVGTIVGGIVPVIVDLRDQVSGAYETLVRIQMSTDPATPEGVVLTALTINTVTQVNVKALPKLNVGRNEIYVGAGDPSDTMVLWPDLRGDLWKKDAYDSQNIASQPVSLLRTYTAVVYPAVLSQDAYLTYRLDAPADITRLVYGGRLYNFSAGSYIDFLHSFDGGATWLQSFRFSDIGAPYDVVHYETVTDIPPGVRTVLFKYVMHNTGANASHATGLYSVRMEADYLPATDAPAAIDVTLRWLEVNADRTTVARSHKERVSEFPFKYIIDVGGSDHPQMDSMTVNVAEAGDGIDYGYSDGRDVGGDKYVYTKRTDGTESREEHAVLRLAGAVGFSGVAGRCQYHGLDRRHRRRAGNRLDFVLLGTVLDVWTDGRFQLDLGEHPGHQRCPSESVRLPGLGRAEGTDPGPRREYSRRPTASRSSVRASCRHHSGRRTSPSITCCPTMSGRRPGVSSWCWGRRHRSAT